MENQRVQEKHRLLESTKCTECNQIRAIEDLAFCKFCGQEPDATALSEGYYCLRHCFESECGHALDCSKPGHESCWDAHLPSTRSNKFKNHVQYRAADDMFIQLILYSEVDKKRQRELHRRDRAREWFRVTLARPTVQGAKPTLQVSDRFRKLCKSTSTSSPPSFVSFIGDTGVGKSTLVRAMIMVGAIETWKAGRKSAGTSPSIDLQELIREQDWGPVTRSKHIDLSNQPTSVGVHLYKDPNDVGIRLDDSENGGAVESLPILLADCEGFRGGTGLTNAEHGIRELMIKETAKLPTRRRSPSSGSTQEIVDGMDPGIIIKDCDITAPDFDRAGKESAELFYARYLYAFSDVIVFVTSEDQRLNDDMRRLLEWSATAMTKSIVQKSAKTLIVVVNGPKRHFNEWYNSETLKNKLLRDFGPLWQHSEELRRFVDDHNQSTELRSNRIHDNQSLFELLFQDVKMCYIPRKDFAPPDKLYGQYLQLRNMILQGTRDGQRVRSRSFDLYNVPAMWRLLDKAFDHFANSKEPFDFYTASRKDSPTPISVPGHIANLLRLVGTEASSMGRFVDLVACCMMVYTLRTYDLAREPKEIFRNEIQAKCRDAIKIYGQKMQQCEAAMTNQSRCILRCFEHRDQHCDNKSQRTPGKFYTTVAEDSASLMQLVNEIEKVYIGLYHSTFTNTTKDFYADARTTTELLALRRTVFSKVRLQRTGTVNKASFSDNTKPGALPVSTKTCLACLQSAPDHVLNCGHIYCSDCIKDFGQPLDARRYCYILDSCLLCGDAELQVKKKQYVQLDNRFGGARIMTLDGGGIRGIVELAILDKIVERIGLPVPMRELFDLIVGTSTGGIVALALTMADPKLSIAELKTLFQSLAKQTFQYDRLSELDFFDILPHGTIASVFTILKFIKSRYDPMKLRSALQEVFKPERPIFGDCVPEMGYRQARVAVTSTTGGGPCAFSNYSRYYFASDSGRNQESASMCQETLSEDLVVDNGLLRADDPAQGFKIWQAAMATAAAPLFFPPYEHEEPGSRVPFKQTFVDGALHSNSPVTFALEERNRIWPSHRCSRSVDILVAVGTASQRIDDFALPKFIDVAGSGDVAKFFRNTVDSEEAWKKFQRTFEYKEWIHYRLNISLDSKIQLDQWKKMEELMQLVDTRYHESNQRGSLYHQIGEVADRLTATLFFYEPQEYVALHGTEYISGQIWCRLETPSEAFRLLISRIEGIYFHRLTNQSTNPLECSFVTNNRSRRTFKELRSSLMQSQQSFSLPWSIDCKGDGTEQICIKVELSPPGGLICSGARAKKVNISGFPTTFNRIKESLKCRGVK